MAAASLFKYVRLAYLSKPVGDRALYKMLRVRKPSRILQMGVGDGRRTLSLLSVAARFATEPLEFTAIDLFEMRGKELPGLKLKDAHKQLKQFGLTPRLLPGHPYESLSMMANSLPEIDLVLIDADQDADSVAKSWFYVPRMLHAETLVMRETRDAAGQSVWSPISQVEIAQLAKTATRLRRAA